MNRLRLCFLAFCRNTGVDGRTGELWTSCWVSSGWTDLLVASRVPRSLLLFLVVIVVIGCTLEDVAYGQEGPVSVRAGELSSSTMSVASLRPYFPC
jgi:hypothetical protein